MNKSSSYQKGQKLKFKYDFTVFNEDHVEVVAIPRGTIVTVSGVDEWDCVITEETFDSKLFNNNLKNGWHESWLERYDPIDALVEAVGC